MRRTLTPWRLGGLLALSAPAWAQSVPPAGEGTGTQGTTVVTQDNLEGIREGSYVRVYNGRAWVR